MNRAILLISVAGLSGCGTIDQLNYLVNESTASIHENTCIIEQNTEVVLINASLVNESTQTLIQNQKSLEAAKKESSDDSETEKLEEVDVEVKKK